MKPLALSVAACCAALTSGAFASAPEKSKSEKQALTSAGPQRGLARALRLDEGRLSPDIVRKLLPEGWRLELDGLPAGVAGMAVGPERADGRAVVLLSRTGPLPPPATWGEAKTRAILARSVGAGVSVTKIEPAGLLGGPTVEGERTEAGGPVRVSYLFTSEPAGWMLTILAPKTQLASIQDRIATIVGAR